MNIKITNKIEEANLITHSGTFHADEIFSTVILSKIMKKMVLIRVPEVVGEVDTNVIVYDIGGKKFDHHQLGGNGERANGTKYASCGLIWKEFGKKVLEKYKVEEIDYVFEYIDQNLIQFIDANDNGILPKLDTEYRNVHISYIIGLFNSKWNEDESLQDEYFLKALNLAEIIFDEFLKDTLVKMKAKNMVEEAINQNYDGYIILEKSVPWKEFLIKSNNPKSKTINYVIFPSKRGGYCIYAVPKEIGSFENRKNLPKSWRGLRDEKLREASGIKSARFCHNAGFICTVEDKKDAIEMAKIANENNN